MSLCKEKPEHLPPLDVIGLQQSEAPHLMTRGGSARSRQSAGTGVQLGLRTDAPAAAAGSSTRASPSALPMGQFSMSIRSLDDRWRTNEDKAVRSTSTINFPGHVLGVGRASSLHRSVSQSTVTSSVSGSNGNKRTRSKRGEQRNDSSRMMHSSNGGCGE